MGPPTPRGVLQGDVQDVPIGARTVNGLKGRTISDVAPAQNQPYVWDGAKWKPTTMTAAMVTNAADLSATSAQAFAGPIAAQYLALGPNVSSALTSGAITIGSSSCRITSTDGSTLSVINGKPSGPPANDTWLLVLVNSSGSTIPYTTGGASGVGLATAGSLPSGQRLFLYFDPNSLLWIPYAQSLGTLGPAQAASVFGRIGAIVATSGDYTASQVTNAADKSSASAQTFAGALGYGPSGSGIGGAVTQATSFNTGVTLNKITGTITIFTSTTTAGTVSEFVVTNSTVSAGDTVIVSWGTGTNTGNLLSVSNVGNGTFRITWEATQSLASSARTINFAVIKAVAS